MSKSRLRQSAGMLKYKVLDCWPYKFKEMHATRLRHKLRDKVFKLPQIPAPDKAEVEIHMFCGKKQLDMGIWASWSIMRFIKNAVLFVHSDGTLRDKDNCSWQKVIPSIIIVSKKEADNRAADVLATDYPLLYTWRCHNWCSAQVVDMNLFGESDRLVIMDSDVLCFRKPTELQASLALDEPVYRWNRDIRSAYLADIELLNEITDLLLPEAFNAGFQLTPRLGNRDFEHLERMINLLKADVRIDTNHFWSTQTYYAMCAARCSNAQALPNSYAVTLGQTQDDAVVRHYVGIPSVRPRYFTEGLPKILNLGFKLKAPLL